MLREICEHPVRAKARIAVKRTLLGTTRGLIGDGVYGKLRSIWLRRRSSES
jgi:hypothetical protein